MRKITTPLSKDEVKNMKVGEMYYLSGKILCGRDAVLPRLTEILEENNGKYDKYDLEGGAIFHTAVSVAGVGPTSSNKLEIETSIPLLSKYGIRVHLGKGKIQPKTIEALDENNSLYAIIPPVSALLNVKTKSKSLIDFPELGMEALYLLEVEDYPIIIGAVNGRSIYD